MALSNDAVKRLMIALGSATVGNEVASAINKGSAAMDNEPGLFGIAAIIVATATSTTTDFGALKVGDTVIQIPLTEGPADYLGAVITLGTLPEAAVVGDLYIAFRPFTPPTATAVKF